MAARTLSGAKGAQGGDPIISRAAELAPGGTPSEGWRYDGSAVRYESVGCSVRLADSAAVFEHLFEDVVQLCIWNRTRDEILAGYLERSVGSGAWERRVVVPVVEPNLDEAVEGLLAGFEDGLGRIRLTTELTCLIDLFATLSDTQRVGVRMVATQRRPCPRFHTDGVGLRLLCTWVGEDTEWVAGEDVVEAASESREDGLSLWGPVRPGATLHRMNPFAIGVFKGVGWPGNRGRGAVHRSPQPADWRVWLSLDAL